MTSPKLYAGSTINPTNPPAPYSLSNHATNHDDHWDTTAARARRNPPTRSREFTRTFTRSTASERLSDKTSKSSPRHHRVVRLQRRREEYEKNGMECYAQGIEELQRHHGGRGLLPPSACVFFPLPPTLHLRRPQAAPRQPSCRAPPSNGATSSTSSRVLRATKEY